MKINNSNVVQGPKPLTITEVKVEPSKVSSEQVAPSSSEQIAENKTVVGNQRLNSLTAILMGIAQGANLADPIAAEIAVQAAAEQIIGWQFKEKVKKEEAWKGLIGELAEYVSGEDGDPHIKKRLFSVLAKMKKKKLIERDVR